MTEAAPRTLLHRYATWLVKHARLVVAGTFAITIACGVLASHLSISTDLWALLPPNYPSVKSLKTLSRRVGGFGMLSMLVESPDPQANMRFADAVVAKIKDRLGDQIVTLDYKVDDVRSFYESHAAVFLSLEDLENIEAELKAAIAAKKMKASPLPFDLELDDPAEKAAAVSPLDQIKERIKKVSARFDRYPSGYYTGEDGRLLAIFIRPKVSGTDAKNARPFLRAMNELVAETQPAAFHPALKVGYTGNFQLALDESDSIKRDLVSTAGLCVGLIALVVIAYFRSTRVFLMLGATLLCGVVMAFGLAWAVVGYLNIQTAFLGSLIMGTGINYGIILLARYLEERRAGHGLAMATETAIGTTFLSTLTAAMTTAVSFGTLLSSSISSFQHFAVIGGGGILFCWLLSYSFLPALLTITDGLLHGVDGRRGVTQLPRLLIQWPARNPVVSLAVGGVLAVVSLIGFVRFLPDALQADGRKLRNRSSLESGAAKLDVRLAKFRPSSGAPGLVVTDSLEDARLVCQVINERNARLGNDKSPTGVCRSIFDLLPTQQEQKLVIARRIKQTLDGIPSELLDSELQRTLSDLRHKISLEPITLESLPETLVRQFRERSGELGRVVSIDPPTGPGRDLWIAQNLFAFADALRHIELPDGRVISSSGDSVVFADILREIRMDTPRTTAASLLGVILVVALALRGNRGTLHVVGSLLVGVAWMVGVQALFDVKLNFFNFVALPTTFGIAVDYSINIYARFEANQGERRQRVLDALRSTGGAVVLCSLTTIIGYYTLIIADNLALVSFGKLAIIGELACLVSAMVVLPAALVLDRRA